MKASLRRLVGAGIASAMAAIGSSSPPLSFAGHPPAVLELVPPPGAAGEPAGAGQRWLRATRAVLDDAVEVGVPFAAVTDLTGSEGVSTAFAFDAHGGQMLELKLARDSAEAESTRIYVEVFRVVDVLGEALHERLTGLRPERSQSTHAAAERRHLPRASADRRRRYRPLSLDPRARGHAAIPGGGRPRGCDPELVRRVPR